MNTPDNVIDALLDGTAAALDIPNHLYERAVREYERIGRWLIETCRAPASTLIYPQGSFRIGTVVRPVVEDDHYDIDLVFWQDIAKQNVTQAELKAAVGALLADFVEAHSGTHDCPHLVERGRCWTLVYDALGFHLDVLPAIPDADDGASTSILLTDRALFRWQHSNPIAYASWFRGRTTIAEFERARELVAKALGRSIEQVPEFLVRTQLQRVVQILKRHRDLHFAANLDLRPPSILVTTLAGLAHQAAAPSLLAAVRNVLQRMPAFIECRSGTWWVENPVQPEENFADKWNTHTGRRGAFLEWCTALDAELAVMPEVRGLDEIAKRLTPWLGELAVKEAVAGIGDRFGAAAASGRLGVSRSGLVTAVAAGAPSLAIPRHTFHGPRS